MQQSNFDPKAVLHVISDTHYRFVNEEEARILALVELGYKNEEIATMLEVDTSTVRRHVHDIAHKVFDSTDVPPDRDKLRTWIPRHFECCTKGVQEMLESGQILRG